MPCPIETLARLVQQLYAIDYKDRLGQPLRGLKALAEARDLLDDLGVLPADHAPRSPQALTRDLSLIPAEPKSWAPRQDEAPA